MNLIKKDTVSFPSIIDELLRPEWLGGLQNFNGNGNIPAVNIKETDTNFELELAIPGKKKEDFNIEIDHNVLTISSEEEKEEKEEKENGSYSRREYYYSSFSRAFTLPTSINSDAINAGYENGILKVTLPKKPEALPTPKKRIQIA